jgi:hypothetical protein
MPKPEKKFRLPRPKPKKRESESGDSDAETEKEPFYKNQNFIILALAVVFCLTLLGIVLIKESGDGGGGAKKKPEAAASPTPEKITFAFNDRKDISNRAGKQATVTGTVRDVVEEEGSSKILVRFEGADERDVLLAFDLKKGDFSKWKLGKFKGQKISATGVVEIADRRLFLDMASMDDLRPAGGQP